LELNVDLVLHHRPSALSGTQLPGWITVSVVSHVLILAAGLGTAPPRAPYRSPALTVEILPLALEKQHATTAPQALPVTPPQSQSPEPTASVQRAQREAAGRANVRGPLPIENYFQLSEVDVRAEPINEVLLRYPWLAYRQRMSGVVRFRLFINEQGGLDKADLIEATPPGHFEDAAVEAVTKLQFSPARKNGRPVKSQKTIEVVFDPEFSETAR
jgi:TonB family protein